MLVADILTRDRIDVVGVIGGSQVFCELLGMSAQSRVLKHAGDTGSLCEAFGTESKNVTP